MGFLAKLGKIALQVTQVISGFAPLAQTMYPGQSDKIAVVSVDSAEIASIIAQMEMIGQALALPGDQKLKGASVPVAQVILKSSVLANRKIDNPALFQAGVTKVTDGWADIMNSLHDSGLQTDNKT